MARQSLTLLSMRHIGLAAIFCLLVVLAACSDDEVGDENQPNGGDDVALTDTSTGGDDVGATDPDTGTTDPDRDTGTGDTGTTDPDTGSTDPDTGSTDPDTGTTDPDVGDPDVGDPDVGDPDVGDPDVGDSCSQVCGDITGTGEVTQADVDYLQSIIDADVEISDCELLNGDVTATGSLDEDDIYYLQLMVDGVIEGACTTCDNQCGDVNSDGTLNILDGAKIFAFSEGSEIPNLCEFQAADISGTGAVEELDIDLFYLHEAGDLDLTDGCSSCENSCGDANGDGQVNLTDLLTANAFIQGDLTPSVCEFLAADINGDGVIDERDRNAIGGFVSGSIESINGACPTCTEGCGDITGTGDPGASDNSRINAFISGSETPTICEYFAADINNDGTIDEADKNMLSAMLLGDLEIPDGACPLCDKTCGDVTDTGSVSSLDTLAVLDFISGDEIPTVCEFVTADVKLDGILDLGDVHAIGRLTFDPELTGGCERCDRACGNVTGEYSDNGEDMINLNDTTAIYQHVEEEEPLTDLCDLWAAKVTMDLNENTTITHDDRDRVFNHIATGGGVELQCAE